MLEQPIIIENFNQGSGDSPHAGFGNIVNVDIHTIPGIARIAMKTTRVTHAPVAEQTFTVNTSTDRLTIGTAITNLAPVSLSSTGTLPVPLNGTTTYFVINDSGNTYLASSYGSALVGVTGAINITTNGTATHSIVTVNPNRSIWMGADSSGNPYMFDVAGRLWRKGSSGDDTNIWEFMTDVASSVGTGATYWKNHILLGRDTTIDSFSISTGTARTSLVGNLQSNSYHTMLVGQDDIVYYGNGRYIGSIQELSGQTFNPGNSSSFSANNQALDLPQDYSVRCFSELGRNLLIGTVFGGGSQNKIGDIFPWDRVSLSFNLPIRVGENGIYSLLTSNNLTYIVAGQEGKMYVTNGTSVELVRNLPIEVDDFTIISEPDAIDVHKGEILYGISETAGTTPPIGVYGIKDNTIRCANIISTGSNGTATAVRIGSVLSVSNNDYYVGWSDGTDAGIDRIGLSSNRYTGYSAFIESPYYVIGTRKKQASIDNIDFELDRALATGEGIRISYRTNLSTSFTDFTELITVDFATYGAVKNFPINKSLTNLEGIQFKIAITTGASSSTSPRVRRIVIQ